MDCVTDVLHNVCPNCGGGFEKRPTRPTNCFTNNCIENYPASTKITFNPINKGKFRMILDKFIHIEPTSR